MSQAGLVWRYILQSTLELGCMQLKSWLDSQQAGGNKMVQSHCWSKKTQNVCHMILMSSKHVGEYCYFHCE